MTTLATLDTTQLSQLRRDLDEAAAQSSCTVSTGYLPLRRVLALWGFAEMSGAQAYALYNTVTGPVEVAPSFPKRNAKKPAFKVGDRVRATVRLTGAAVEGVVVYVSKSGVVAADENGKPYGVLVNVEAA